MIADALEPFARGPGGVVSGPEGVRIGGVREEIVRLGGPGNADVVQGLQVAGGRRVEYVHVRSVRLQCVGVSGNEENRRS